MFIIQIGCDTMDLRWSHQRRSQGQLHSQTELCNVARRLGLSEEDQRGKWLAEFWKETMFVAIGIPDSWETKQNFVWTASKCQTSESDCQSNHICEMFFLQDAFRVAVALWALSDGKTLSLQLLVGALEGKAGWEILLPSICWVKSEYSVKKTFISTAHPKNWWEKQI